MYVYSCGCCNIQTNRAINWKCVSCLLGLFASSRNRPLGRFMLQVVMSVCCVSVCLCVCLFPPGNSLVMGATIHTRWEIECLPYAEFFLYKQWQTALTGLFGGWRGSGLVWCWCISKCPPSSRLETNSPIMFGHMFGNTDTASPVCWGIIWEYSLFTESGLRPIQS